MVALVKLREQVDPFLRRRIRNSVPWKLPPPLLRYRIGEDTDPFRFFTVGRRLFEYLQLSLEGFEVKLSDLPNVLDFGCGCGRTLSHLMHAFPHHKFTGTDVDPEAIAWCRSNLIPAEFQVNRYEPPLLFADHSFDLICGISVFTHLDKASQEQWIPELYRLLRPGGALIMTVNGTSAAEHAGVDLTQLSKLPEQGVVFLECDKLSTLHPD